jgi:hypothetical protein
MSDILPWLALMPFTALVSAVLYFYLDEDVSNVVANLLIIGLLLTFFVGTLCMFLWGLMELLHG